MSHNGMSLSTDKVMLLYAAADFLKFTLILLRRFSSKHLSTCFIILAAFYVKVTFPTYSNDTPLFLINQGGKNFEKKFEKRSKKYMLEYRIGLERLR